MSDAFICAYTLNGDGSCTALDEAGVASRAAADTPVWVHLSAHSAEARRWLEKKAQLPDDTLIEALLAEDIRPRMQNREDGVLLILRGVNLNDNAEPEDMVSIRIWVESYFRAVANPWRRAGYATTARVGGRSERHRRSGHHIYRIYCSHVPRHG